MRKTEMLVIMNGLTYLVFTMLFVESSIGYVRVVVSKKTSKTKDALSEECVQACEPLAQECSTTCEQLFNNQQDSSLQSTDLDIAGIGKFFSNVDQCKSWVCEKNTHECQVKCFGGSTEHLNKHNRVYKQLTGTNGHLPPKPAAKFVISQGVSDQPADTSTVPPPPEQAQPPQEESEDKQKNNHDETASSSSSESDEANLEFDSDDTQGKEPLEVQRLKELNDEEKHSKHKHDHHKHHNGKQGLFGADGRVKVKTVEVLPSTAKQSKSKKECVESCANSFASCVKDCDGDSECISQKCEATQISCYNFCTQKKSIDVDVTPPEELQ
jgi:hypothetical protein